MIILSVLILIIYLYAIPYCLGLFFARGFSPEYKTYGRVYVLGFMTEFAVTEILFLFFYFLKMHFTPFAITLAVTLLLLSAVSLVLNRKELKTIHFIKTDYSIIVLALITLFLIVMRNVQGINDGDDAFVLGVALTTKTTDCFYLTDYYTGRLMAGTNYLRHLLAGNPMYIAFLSKISFVHPTILAHRVLSSVYIVMKSIIIYDIAELLFDKEMKKYRSIFASLVLFISVWDFHSYMTDSTFFLTRTWQGKAMFCGLIIPLVLEIMLLIGKEEGKKTIMFAGLAVMCASAVFMTPAAMYLYSVLVAVTGISTGVAVRKPKSIAATFLSLTPMILFFAIYWRFCR